MGLPFLIARGSDGQQEIRRFETFISFMQMTNILDLQIFTVYLQYIYSIFTVNELASENDTFVKRDTAFLMASSVSS